MLSNRVKVIALCAGGWVLVTAAYMACNIVYLPSAFYRCPTVPTNANWVDRIGQIEVDITEPKECPVIIEGATGAIGFQNYTANVRVNAAYLASSRKMEYTFLNANKVPLKTLITTLSGSPVASTQTHGTYDVGTAGNVTTKRDYVRNAIFTTAGVATGEVQLDYKYKAAPTMSGATTRNPGYVSMTANAPAIQHPVTYQWWVDGILQGPPAGSTTYYYTYGKNITTPGIHTFKAVIIDQKKASYTVSRLVEIKPPLSCAPQRIC